MLIIKDALMNLWSRRPHFVIRLGLFSKAFIILMIVSLLYPHQIYQPKVANNIVKAKVMMKNAVKIISSTTLSIALERHRERK